MKDQPHRSHFLNLQSYACASIGGSYPTSRNLDARESGKHFRLATKGGILDRCVGSHLGSFLEGKKTLKKEAVHSRLVTVNFNNQGNLHMRFVLGSYEISRSTHLSAKILKVSIEA